MKCDLALMKKEIAALLPSAHPDGGEATLLITIYKKKYLDRRSLRWIINRLARCYNVDINAVKQNYGPLLGMKRYIPLPLSSKLIYLPLTLKTNTIPIDLKLGYISLSEIAAIKKGKDGNTLVLRSGIELCCYNKLPTIEKRQREGRLLQKILKSELPGEKTAYTVKHDSSMVAEKNWSEEEIARFTAAFLHFWQHS